MPFDWKPLMEEAPDTPVSRGSLLKFQDRYWSDEIVVLTVCEWVGDPEVRYALVRLTGGKAGINPLQLIPNSAFEPGETLSVGWLQRNWNHWVWLETELASVSICHSPVSPRCFE